MIFFRKCGACSKTKLFVHKRVYRLGGKAGTITSKSELCRKCFKNVGRMLEGSKRP